MHETFLLALEKKKTATISLGLAPHLILAQADAQKLKMTDTIFGIMTVTREVIR